jgi:long-chain fatty acid transport protein
MKKLLVLSLLASPVLVKAQAFSTGYAGEKQNGMGGAGSALPLDASSSGSNPGAMSFVNGNSITVGGAAAISNTTYLDANNGSLAHSKNAVGTPFHAFFVYGVKDSSSLLGKFKFGIGVSTPFGGDSHWQSDWTGKYSIIDKNLKSVVIAPGVSFKITSKLSIGAALGYSESTLHVENGVPVSQTANVVMDFKSRGVGFGGGIYYKASEKLSFALGYVSQVNNKSYKGTATFTVPSLLNSQFPTGPATTKSSIPAAVAFGTGYRVNDKLTLAFDITYGFWKCFDSTIFVYTAATPTSALSSTRLPNKYKNAVSVRLGAQYKIMDKCTARAGISYEQTPVPTDYVYPETPDADRINLTCGASYVINKKFSLDFSYRFVDVVKRTSTNVYSKMSGTYKTYAHVTGLSLNYNF